jgi:dolichol-phosphate mannosyltransferase
MILSRGSSLIYRILLDWNIYTYTSLFRAYRRRVIDDISFQSDGFLAGTELLVKGMMKGYKVAEYPTALYKRIFGVSKAKLMRTILAHLRFQGWILLKRVQSGSERLSRKKA